MCPANLSCMPNTTVDIQIISQSDYVSDIIRKPSQDSGTQSNKVGDWWREAVWEAFCVKMLAYCFHAGT